MMLKEMLETKTFPRDKLFDFSRRAQNYTKCLHLSRTRMVLCSRFWPDQKKCSWKKNTFRLLIDLFLFRKAEMELMLYLENWSLLYC